MVVQILVLATVLNGTGILVNGAVILCANRLSRAMARPGRFRRALQIALGTVFTALALRLAVDGGR